MRINRYVLDANIWISYLIKNEEDKLLHFLVENKITIFICKELLIEIKRVLSYEHLECYKVNIKEAINFIMYIGYDIELHYPIKRYIPGDEDDDYIIALALQTNAGYVTSGDKHILREKENLENKYRMLKIISKSEFEIMMK